MTTKKTSPSFKEKTQKNQPFLYNNNLLSQFKELFKKYLPEHGEILLDDCIEKNYDYKKILQEAYSLLYDNQKNHFLDDVKKISVD